MKTFNISLSFVFSFILLAISCSKEEVQTFDKFNTKIALTAPKISSNFANGDTINIKGLITSDVSMHGYEILLHKQNEAPKSVKNKHTHGKSINVNDIWVVDFADKQVVELEVVALIDHTGNTLSEKRKVKCN